MEFDDIEHQMETGKADYIVEELKAQIHEGKLREREKLPSERELSDQYGVSRMTARRALQMLEGEGLVTRYPVRGTFVSGIRERQREHHGAEDELRTAGSFIKAVKERGRKPAVDFLEQPSLVAANAEISENLQLPLGSLVLKRYRLQSVDKLPYRLIESYYPADLFGELVINNIEIGETPLFDWLQERRGLTDVHAEEDLIARLATPDERSLLQISPNAPVVAFERRVWANNGRVIEWASITAVAALYTFSYEYDIPARNI